MVLFGHYSCLSDTFPMPGILEISFINALGLHILFISSLHAILCTINYSEIYIKVYLIDSWLFKKSIQTKDAIEDDNVLLADSKLPSSWIAACFNHGWPEQLQ